MELNKTLARLSQKGVWAGGKGHSSKAAGGELRLKRKQEESLAALGYGNVETVHVSLFYDHSSEFPFHIGFFWGRLRRGIY